MPEVIRPSSTHFHGFEYHIFQCDRSNTDWHFQLVNLAEQIKECASPSLVKLMREDLDRIREEERFLGPDDV